MAKRYLMSLPLLFALAANARADDPTPWLSVHIEGGLTGHGPLTITVDSAGRAHVATTTTNSKIDYTAQLSPGEIAWIKTLADQGFIASNPDSRDLVTDVPTKTISLSESGKTKSATFTVDPSFDALVTLLYKLFYQAVAMDNLLHDKPYDVNVGVNPRLSGGKILQPAVFREPLGTYILKQKAGMNDGALEALAYVATPEEFAGTLAQLVEGSTGKDRDILFGIITRHPYYANIPKSHLQAYLPLLLAERAKRSPDTVTRAVDSIEKYLQSK